MQSYIKAPSIHIRNAYLAFRDTVLFDQLNLTLPGGKCTCLLGPSGIGKSTLLRLIAGLITTETASHEKTVIRAEISCDSDLPLSKQIAYMAQTDLLLPWLNVLDNVLIGSRLRHEPREKRTRLKEQAKELLHTVGLSNALELYPRQLSGGMRQRVALARTIIENKPIVLMDEPFSALDTITRYKLQTMAADLLRNRTVLFITHDPLEALRLADEIFIMSGQPAQLHAPLELNTPTPRDSGEPRLLELQAALLHELTSSYEAGA
jgi:putative hydroxymethylpyrimidine transport system ATP-binding protein